VSDGLGTHRRTRTWPRTGRTLRRLIVSGNGTISLDALAWCADVGVAVVTLDVEGRITCVSAQGTDDARLRRAQILATADEVLALELAYPLIRAKIVGQARVADSELDRPDVADALRRIGSRVVYSLERLNDIEAEAAKLYFGAWDGVRMRFRPADRARVRDGWESFGCRGSELYHGNRSMRATNPINAMLNYLYAVAESECRIG
jgi:CRISPR/Cas system-associated endonuclease Cas1